MIDPVEGWRAVGRGLVASSRRTDSGTMRRVDGSILLEVLVDGCVGASRFGRPRAAAAHERSVDKLALNAASWSA